MAVSIFLTSVWINKLLAATNVHSRCLLFDELYDLVQVGHGEIVLG